MPIHFAISNCRTIVLTSQKIEPCTAPHVMARLERAIGGSTMLRVMAPSKRAPNFNSFLLNQCSKITASPLSPPTPHDRPKCRRNDDAFKRLIFP